MRSVDIDGQRQILQIVSPPKAEVFRPVQIPTSIISRPQPIREGNTNSMVTLQKQNSSCSKLIKSRTNYQDFVK